MSIWQKPPLGALPLVGHPLARGLVGCWLMNEGSGNKVFDLSGNGNHGVFVLSPTWVAGAIGPSIHFPNTDDHIICGSNSSLDIMSEITIVASFSCDDVLDNDSIVGRQGKEAYWLLLENAHLQFFTGGTEATSSNLLTNNIRVQIAVSREDAKDETKFYFNGVYDSTSATGGAIQSSVGNDLYIGVDARDGAGLDFEGEIDYIYIFNRVLSASEFALLYREPFCMFEREPIELWVAATSVGVPAGAAGAMTTNTGYWGITV